MATRAPLVLLHAWPLDSRMWRPQVAALRSEGEVLALDLPGFGNRAPVPGDASLDDWAAELARELRSTGFERAVFAGCSMGGYTSLAMLRVDPALVAGIALVNSRALPDSPQQSVARAKTIARIDAEGTGFIVDDAPLALSPVTRERKPDVVAAIRVMAADAGARELMAAYRAIGSRPDMEQALARSRVPVAIVAGEDDPNIPISEARDLAASITGARFTTVPETGHISPMENPDVVTNALATFWKEIS